MKAWLEHLFIPCTENNFKPNMLERLSVGIMLVLILLTFVITNVGTLLWIGSDWLVSTVLPAVIVDLTNDERTEVEAPSLLRSNVLDDAAQRKAEHMAKYGYFAHYSPDGISPWYWFDEVGYDYVHAGENLAVHFTDSKEVVAAWMKSPLHRDNILSGNYTEIGVGTAKGEYKGFPTVFVVQLFGTRAGPVAPVVEAVARGSETEGVIDITGSETVLGENDSITEERVVLGDSVESAPHVGTMTVDASHNEALSSQRAPGEMKETGDADTDKSPITIGELRRNTAVVYSNLATSSREGVPLTREEHVGGGESGARGEDVTELGKTMTRPHLWLQIIYGLLALIVIIALVLSVVIEWRRQHPAQIAYAGGLLIIMALLLYVHTTLTAGVTIA